MDAVILVDAAPGFEDSVEASLRKNHAVVNVARVKQGNYDMVVLVRVSDESSLTRLVSSDLRMVSGVRGVQRLADPSPDLMKRLSA